MCRIFLLLQSTQDFEIAWNHGGIKVVAPDVELIRMALDAWLQEGDEDAVLCWNSELGEVPSFDRLSKLLESKVDVWHSGLSLGMGGHPLVVSYVVPTWTFQANPDHSIVATSWRISLNACLVRRRVVRILGGLRKGFRTLEMAGLEMGHRWIRNGAVMRHVPSIGGVVGSRNFHFDATANVVGKGTRRYYDVECKLNAWELEDELRFAYYRFGEKWLHWATFRMVYTRKAYLLDAIRTWRTVLKDNRPQDPESYFQESRCEKNPNDSTQFSSRNKYKSVTVLIPTIDRYPYLHVVLDQLRCQTVRPLEVIIIDQTPVDRRQILSVKMYDELNISVIYQDRLGQCTSRNAGLRLAQGEFVLLLDDDVEIKPDLLEKHLIHLQTTESEVSSGVAEEVGSGALPPEFRVARVSDVFPAGNTLALRSTLAKSGGFDLAYDRGQRADGDLGMRIYLSGALMMLNPRISVLHHHAPSGGLRINKARITTRAKSRQRLFGKNLLSVWDLYRGLRYFPECEVRELMWISALGTFSCDGPFLRRVIRVPLALIWLPQTIQTLRKRLKSAQGMLHNYPQIPGITA
jgi:glycosyltransferase involved in cell wall biosynthesis